MTTKRSRTVAVVASLSAVATFTASTSAATGTLTIDSVGGQQVKKGKVATPVSGVVPVQGTCVARRWRARTAPAPLVADAGDSAFVASGDRSRRCSAPASAARSRTRSRGRPRPARSPRAPTAPRRCSTPPASPPASHPVDAEGHRCGRRLGDRHRAGRRVAEPDARRCSTSRARRAPGRRSATARPASSTSRSPCPPVRRAIDIAVTWTVPINDYDLVAPRPRRRRARSASAERRRRRRRPSTSSASTPGTWTARVDEVRNDHRHGPRRRDGDVAGVDPRPTVDSGGPYRFAIGAPQALDGTVTGGTGAVTTAGTSTATASSSPPAPTSPTTLAPGPPPRHAEGDRRRRPSSAAR